MVYKRYIKRDGKTFGPYYYESYRDEKGRTKTRLVSQPKKIFPFKLLLIISLTLVLIAGFLILNKDLEQESGINPVKTSFGNSKILGSFIKLIGFGVSDSEEVSDSAVNENIEESIENSESSEEVIGEPQVIEEIFPDEQITPEINQTNEVTSEDITEDNNLTNEIETSPWDHPAGRNISAESVQISNESVKAKTGNFCINSSTGNCQITAQENISQINETLQSISEINQTIIENLTISEINQTIQENNLTISESTLQYSAKLGEPVKWKKTLKLDANENKTINNLEVTLPKTAGDVSVRKIFANESVEELEVNVQNEKFITETEPIFSITGEAIRNQDKKSIFNKIFKFFNNFFVLVGRVIDIGENEDEVLVNIREELKGQDEIEIEYYTEAPYSEEIVFSDAHKEINVVGSEEVHYTNILAFSNLSKEVSEEKIRMYRTTGGIREVTIFTAYDLDNNELIDYIEWIVPSLSNQTYELILITKAQHLDSNRNFISDIYDEVKALDNNWSEQINDFEYVRVTFEKNLTNENDITIYARSENVSEIEVYEENKNISIAKFGEIDINKKYQIFLTNLTGSQDTFDLKILGYAVEFDYIVDPFSGSGAGTLADPFKMSNCNQLQELKDALASHY
ncbi:MAG: hypothetical protein Q8O84_02425, partial [Nanoarchaeota archaeon]|nr:hypothetical protein [Nanoarchaeota archaeon]